jgi:cytochrome c oxidase subunit 2
VIRRRIIAGSIARTLAAFAAAAVLGAGCLPSSPTAEGRAIGTLYLGFVAVAAVVAVVVYGLLTWAIVRYRGRPGDEPPAQVHGNLRLEVVWTVLPILTVLALFAGTLVVLTRVEAVTANPRAEVRVEAFRWGWSASYPAAGVTVSGLRETGPEIVLPVDETVRITLVAADVVHAFYVPAFLFKRDAIPGRETVFEITIEEPGAYGGQCAEFCGTFHSRMPFTIRAVSRAEFDAWLASQPGTGEPSPGQS